MNKKEKIKVCVGVSGGVDSSVSLALLRDQGYDVIGVFIRTWQPNWMSCNWQSERRDAIRVCAHLDVPFLELDLEYEYKKGVADYILREYKAGRTPNPDVMCNHEIKFGGFLKWALNNGFDFIATGHYVRLNNRETNMVSLCRGYDTNKDQSYFLWTLKQHQLRHILFPVGNMFKDEVRKCAKKYGLPTANKKDSQGLCFLGDINMKDFLSHYVDKEPGEVLNTDGVVIGSHKGSLFYTIGERHGFSIYAKDKGTHDKPYYVVAKDKDNNTITVSKELSNYNRKDRYLDLSAVVDNKGVLKVGDSLTCQIRYRGDIKIMEIEKYNKQKNTMKVVLNQTDASIASGQSLVFYKDNICLGGGIIE